MKSIMKTFTKKVISIFLLLCFISSSVLTDVGFTINYKNGDQNLAPQSNMSDPAFIEQVFARGFILSHKAINLFIKEAIENFGSTGNKNTIRIYDKALNIIPIRNLYKKTGVFAHLGITTNNVYVDWDIFHNDTVSLHAIIHHEYSEILQWDVFFTDLNIEINKRRIWLQDHISQPDLNLNGTAFEGMTSYDIAKLFHENAASLENVSEKYNTTRLEYDFIEKLLTLYSEDEIFEDISNPTDVILAASEEPKQTLSWIQQNQPDLVGKTIVSLSMEGNIPELGNTQARDANTKGGLGAYQGDKLEGLAQIGMNAFGIQPMYSQIRTGKKDEHGNDITEYVNYKPLIDAEIIIPVFTGKNSIKVETGYESAALN
ncbi:MAG: hypothetical protein PHQ52_06590, partial [Candidatus Omnitrophica bacterium]|nr:hypothetical protein [Candidatus Omnitrophota bacterium]